MPNSTVISKLWYAVIVFLDLSCDQNTLSDLLFCSVFKHQDSFRSSIAAWEAAAKIQHEQDQEMCKKLSTVNDDPLLSETQDLIYSNNETLDSSKLKNTIHSLKNTTHLKALSTALQMARSHRAVAVEMAIIAENDITAHDIENLKLLRTAANHHLQALRLIRETQHMRAASIKPSSTARFWGAAKRVVAANKIGGGKLTAPGRDLSVVSFAFSFSGLTNAYA